MPSIHDPLFNLAPRPPFAWGKSPFRGRGMIFRDELTFSETVAGAPVVDAVRRSLDPALQAFLAQRFAPLDWYDTLPLTYFIAAMARARGVPISQHTREMAAVHVRHALSGFSGVVLKLVSNETVAMWLPRISAWYHDFGKVDVKLVDARRVRGVRTGVPHFLVQQWAFAAVHFTESVLTQAGARDVRGRTLETEPEGTREGCPVYRVGFELSWG